VKDDLFEKTRVQILAKTIFDQTLLTYRPKVIMQRKEQYLTWRSECLGRSEVSVFDGVVTPCGESGRGTCNHS